MALTAQERRREQVGCLSVVKRVAAEIGEGGRELVAHSMGMGLHRFG